MQRKIPRLLWPVISLMSIPLIYNACQGGLGGKGFASAKASCKVGFDRGNVTKIEFDENRQPEIFALRKVRLDSDSVAGGAQAKASAPVVVPSGSELVTIVNNECLIDNAGNLSDTAFSKSALDSGEAHSSLHRQAYTWKSDRAYSDAELEELASRDPCVMGVAWNRKYKMQASFNDPSYGQQTYLPAIKSAESTDLFFNSTGGMNLTGTPVIVAVIDTGVDWQHPDLQNNMFQHSNGIGVDATTIGGSGSVEFNPFDISDIGHGTHVAGLIAAVSGNGVGIVGAMPYRAKIMGVKVFKPENGGGLSTTSQYLVNGIQFAYLNGARVINMSLGSVSSGQTSDPALEAAIDQAISRGVVVTTVIGNASGSAAGTLIDGTSMSSIPAQYSTKAGVLGVGSFDVSSGLKSSFSHYSTTYAEVGAPGAEVGDTGIVSLKPRAIGSYGRLAGTSQAGPLVSAAAALTIGIIKEAYGGVGPLPSETERLILASSSKSTALNPYFKDGNKLDLLSLVQRINLDYPYTRVGATGMGPPPNSNCAN